MWSLNVQPNFTVCGWMYLKRVGFQQHLNSIFPQNLGHFLAYLRIFSSLQLFIPLDHRHLAAEPPEHLSKFQGDVAAAKNH